MSTFSDVDFPFLKSLHLNVGHFEERWFIFKFLTGCPSLEDLEVENITIANMSVFSDRVHKRLPKLVRANLSNTSIYSTPIIYLPSEPFRTVESLRLVEVTFVLNLFKLNIIMLVTIVTYTYVLSFYL
jgi:hypothetical protein